MNRKDEGLVRLIVAQGNYEYAPGFLPIKQGRFSPGSPGFYPRVQLICVRDPAPLRDLPYSVHTAVVIDRASGPTVRLIEGTFDLTLAQAEELLA